MEKNQRQQTEMQKDSEVIIQETTASDNDAQSADSCEESKFKILEIFFFHLQLYLNYIRYNDYDVYLHRFSIPMDRIMCSSLIEDLSRNGTNIY